MRWLGGQRVLASKPDDLSSGDLHDRRRESAPVGCCLTPTCAPWYSQIPQEQTNTRNKKRYSKMSENPMNLRKDSSFCLYVHLKVGKFFQEICLGPLSGGGDLQVPRARAVVLPLREVLVSSSLLRQNPWQNQHRAGKGLLCTTV